MCNEKNKQTNTSKCEMKFEKKIKNLIIKTSKRKIANTKQNKQTCRRRAHTKNVPPSCPTIPE